MEHPLEKFAYCPVCGSKHFVVNNFKSKKCGDCGFTYYANPCSATAAFILRQPEGKEQERWHTIKITNLTYCIGKEAGAAFHNHREKPLTMEDAYHIIGCFPCRDVP